MPDTLPDTLATDLGELLAAETHSLLAYLAQAGPHLTAETYSFWPVVTEAAAAGRRHAGRLSQLLDELDLPVGVGHFDGRTAGCHDVTVNAVLPRLIREKQRQIGLYERVLQRLADQPMFRGVRDLLEDLLRDHQFLLERMQNLQPAAAGSAPPVTSTGKTSSGSTRRLRC